MINETTVVDCIQKFSKILTRLGEVKSVQAEGVSKTVESMSLNDTEKSWNVTGIAQVPTTGLSASGVTSGVGLGFPGKSIIIPLYSLIFFLSITGNLLVILTLARNRRMRTVTNVFLLNLAISDLLLGVFCVPITLVGQILRNFIFGHYMCKMIPFFQAVAVSVGVYTLVAISLERYFAICRPLQSRKWQTKSHAYKTIIAVWLLTTTWNVPILFVSQLKPIRNTGRFKCREIWPNPLSEKTFNLILDFLLLVLPLCIMGMAYSLIVSKLWKGMRNEILHHRTFHQAGKLNSPGNDVGEPSIELSSHSQSHYSICKGASNTCNSEPPRTAVWNMSSTRDVRDTGSSEILTCRNGKSVVVRWQKKHQNDRVEVSIPKKAVQENSPMQFMPGQTKRLGVRETNGSVNRSGGGMSLSLGAYGKSSRTIRSTYTGKSIESKKKVIRMLFVLVAEFFLAWTPLYVMNTWYLFNPEAVYHIIGPVGVSLIQLLAYTSSCCNPITYCFMNRKFRQAFLKVFQIGFSAKSKTGPPIIMRASEVSGNDSLIFGVPGSTCNKSGWSAKSVFSTGFWEKISGRCITSQQGSIATSNVESPDTINLHSISLTSSDQVELSNKDEGQSDGLGYVQNLDTEDASSTDDNEETDDHCESEFRYRVTWGCVSPKSKPLGTNPHELYS